MGIEEARTAAAAMPAGDPFLGRVLVVRGLSLLPSHVRCTGRPRPDENTLCSRLKVKSMRSREWLRSRVVGRDDTRPPRRARVMGGHLGVRLACPASPNPLLAPCTVHELARAGAVGMVLAARPGCPAAAAAAAAAVHVHARARAPRPRVHARVYAGF